MLLIYRPPICYPYRSAVILFSENAMRTDIYTLDDIRIELINMLCLQYVEKLLKDGRISEKHAEKLIKRYTAKCTGKKK